MSYEQAVVVIDANGVRSGRVLPNTGVLTDEGFLIMDRIKMEINEAQAGALTSRDVEARDFLTGPVVALLVKREAAYDTLLAAKTQLDDVYVSSDAWSTLRDKTIFFPTQPQLERTVVLIKPEYTHDDYTSMVETIESNDFVIIGKLARILTPDVAKELLGDNVETIEYCTNSLSVALVLEKVGAIDEWQLLLGPEDPELARDIAPNSLRAKFGKSLVNNAIYASESPEKATVDLKLLFPAAFPLERTLGIINPCAASKTSAVMDIIKANGLEIIAKETLTLSGERAEQFFVEHRDRSFFGELTKYMSSAPITVLCLSKPCAVTAWKKLTAPGGVLGGVAPAADQLRSAFYASEDPDAATKEIKFFFPQLTVEKIPNLLEVEDIINKKAAPRPHVEPKQSLNDVLVEGLTQLCRIKPVGDDAIEWLGEWLLRNNPNKPQAGPSTVVEADVSSESTSVPSVVWAVGGPGSGKDDYCKEIVSTHGYEFIDCNEVLDAAVQSGSGYGELIKSCNEARKPVPSSVSVALIKAAIENSTGKSKFLVTGFPSTLDAAFNFENDIMSVDKIVYFDCSKPTRAKRMEATTGVDVAEKMVAADKEFMDKVSPVIDHYSTFSKVSRVSTDGTEAQIKKRIANALA